jgi:transcriptional regulator with XRE-family HTH domain
MSLTAASLVPPRPSLPRLALQMALAESVSALRPAVFGAVIARHRNWLGMDRAVLAARAGVKPHALAEIEHGSLPSLAVAYAIGDALGVDLAELVYETELQISGAPEPVRPTLGQRARPPAAVVQNRPAAFGVIVLRYRLGLRLSADELAERAGLCASELADIESGDLPSLGCALALADALELPADRLLHETRHHATSGTMRLGRRRRALSRQY